MVGSGVRYYSSTTPRETANEKILGQIQDLGELCVVTLNSPHSSPVRVGEKERSTSGILSSNYYTNCKSSMDGSRFFDQ